MKTFSSISNSSSTARLFAGYATIVDSVIRNKALAPADDADELRELANDLWTIVDNYDSEYSNATQEDSLASDVEED